MRLALIVPLALYASTAFAQSTANPIDDYLKFAAVSCEADIVLNNAVIRGTLTRDRVEDMSADTATTSGTKYKAAATQLNKQAAALAALKELRSAELVCQSLVKIRANDTSAGYATRTAPLLDGVQRAAVKVRTELEAGAD